MASDTPTPFDAAIIEMEHALATKVKNRHVLSDYDDGNIGGTNHCLAILHRNRDAWLASQGEEKKALRMFVGSLRRDETRMCWQISDRDISMLKLDKYLSTHIADAEKEQGRNG